jgi:hypothetical protein
MSAEGAGAQPPDRVLVFRVHRDHEDAHRRGLVLQRVQHVEAAAARQVDVEHEHVGGLLAHQQRRLRPCEAVAKQAAG